MPKSIELTTDFFNKSEIEQKVLLKAMEAYLRGEPCNPPHSGKPKTRLQDANS